MEKITYNYQLLKGSAKFICPHCGKKRFVPFVDSNNNPVRDENGIMYGRCDRETECGFFYSPKAKQKVQPVVMPKQPENKAPLWFNSEVTRTDICLTNNLIMFLAQRLPTEAFMDALKKYHVKALSGDVVVWWQISTSGQVRTGKVMHYKTDGKRDHDKPTTWAHKMKNYKAQMHGEELRQCFFGEHLLLHDSRPVAVVESEKTALIMASVDSKYLWLACGGSQMLKNAERCEVLKGREVLLVPDNGQFFNWQTTARKHGWRILTEIEDTFFAGGKDIADLILKLYET